MKPNAARSCLCCLTRPKPDLSHFLEKNTHILVVDKKLGPTPVSNLFVPLYSFAFFHCFACCLDVPTLIFCPRIWVFRVKPTSKYSLLQGRSRIRHRDVSCTQATRTSCGRCCAGILRAVSPWRRCRQKNVGQKLVPWTGPANWRLSFWCPLKSIPFIC